MLILNNIDTRRSKTGYITILAVDPKQRQKRISRSTTEAEYLAVSQEMLLRIHLYSFNGIMN